MEAYQATDTPTAATQAQITVEGFQEPIVLMLGAGRHYPMAVFTHPLDRKWISA